VPGYLITQHDTARMILHDNNVHHVSNCDEQDNLHDNFVRHDLFLNGTQ